MELVVNKDELVEKIISIFRSKIIDASKQQGFDEEETNAHLILNRKKFAEDANNIANLVFAAYGINPEVSE